MTDDIIAATIIPADTIPADAGTSADVLSATENAIPDGTPMPGIPFVPPAEISLTDDLKEIGSALEKLSEDIYLEAKEEVKAE